MKIATILLVVLLTFHCESAKFRVKNFYMSKCSPKQQLIELNNINLNSDNSGNVVVSGSMSSSVDIESPIKVSISVKKRVVGLWIPVGCVNNVGSCTYTDVCQYGINDNDSCPSQLQDNDVPCRCPIPRGNYTIPKKLFLDSQQIKWNVINGKYSARIVARHLSQELGCYNAKFTLY